MSKNANDINHADRAHSKLGASSAYRWLACPGSVKLSEGLPTFTSEYAKEGSAAHELAEYKLRHPRATRFPKELNGYKIEPDMHQYVDIYVAEIKRILADSGGDLSIEERLNLEWVHEGMFGTSDAVIREEFGTLYVVDYKHGMGKAVEVKENKQAMFYALGALLSGDYLDVELIIVQPRAEHPDGPIRRWKTTPERLLEFAKELKEGAIATKAPDAPLRSGDHCGFCPAKGVCPLLHKETMEVALTDFKSDLPTPETLTPKQIASVLAHKTKIKNFLDAVEKMATENLKSGRAIEGVKLVKKRSRRDWDDVDEFIKEFGDEAYEKSLLSVSKAEKVLGKQAIEGLWNRIDTGVVATHSQDRRKAVAYGDPKDDFDAIE